MANPWEIEWAQDAGDPVIAPPDPYKQSGEQRAQRDQQLQETTTSLQNQIAELTIAEKQAKAQEAADAKKVSGEADERAAYKLMKAIGEMSRVAKDANDNGGWFETGTSGSFARSVLPSGTAGYDLAGDIKTLDANFAFDALQAMRDASKTGGALGAITEKELELLKASVANLDPNLGHETFLANVERAKQSYLAKLAMLNPEVATQLGYDAKKAEAALMGLNAEAGGEPVAIDRGASDAPPADIEAIMAKYGAN